MAMMASQSATIRVTRQTRDLLADQARERGVSLSAMLGKIALEAERESVFRAEKEASRVDVSEPMVEAEEREWETALGDGIN